MSASPITATTAVTSPTVLITGVHSGPNPSPGLGLARSLRRAWPGLRLEAVDYSPRATGLSAPEFDRAHVHPDWHGADLDAQCAALVSMVESTGGVLVPGLDLEAELLAARHPGHPGVLAPPPAAFALVAKPAERAAEVLGLAVPEHRRVEGIEDAADFAAAHGWRVWVKGPRHDAVPVTTLPELATALHRVRATWGGPALAQRHVDGVEESIVFAALDGELLGACAMRKTMLTAEGKTWAGTVEPVRGGRLAEFVRVTRWTGGGEVEVIREARTGERYLLEVNPRFPAWVHGATLTGPNLPARLVTAATGLPPHLPERAEADGFVRVVEEIPADPLPAPEHRAFPGSAAAKHPSAMPALSRRLAPARPRPAPGEPDAALARDVAAALPVPPGESPCRVLLRGALESGLDLLGGVCRDVAVATGVATRFAYSVKTNPDRRVLGAVQRRGAMAETVSLSEVRACLDAGFTGDRVVLGGPAKWWRHDGAPVDVGALFCDSVSDFERTVAVVEQGLAHTDILGLRLSTIGVPTRFGIDLSHPPTARAVAKALRTAGIRRIGLHFHHAASRIGAVAWLREFTDAISAAADLCARTGVRVRCVDLGGGWRPGTSRAELAGVLTRAVRVATRALGRPEQVLFEPGKVLAQPAMAVFSTVLDVRDGPDGRAAVVDASVAELPDWAGHPHRVLWRRPGADWRVLGPGDEAVLGRLCMEHDRPRDGLALPADLAAGDHLLFLDAGAYDASMSYRFGT
ncbi:hypothetical protein V5P93_001978 [Actinokineospora auranticolor]|uniref:Diaminopimelate decarboxylase n=1 Tax=Actinokineospora auranticolor TaxID=155976 RepID=A0A2S6GEI0_9PSEU|nr:hypothetical protein [Actinokineospora auranticolor]PPK63622.1 diaminopimelate decarboxylase [Actinokineospora auranticolor]